MSKPLTIDSILEQVQSFIDDDEVQNEARSQAKAQIEAMIADIIGENTDNLMGDAYGIHEAQDDLRDEQRQRATKYNLTLKEGK